MAKHCTQCGKQLNDNEVCNCQQTAQQVAPQPVVQAPAASAPATIQVTGVVADLLVTVKEMFSTPTASIVNLKNRNNFNLALLASAGKAILIGLFSLLYSLVMGGASFASFLMPLLMSLVFDIAMVGIPFIVGLIFNERADIKQIASMNTSSFIILAAGHVVASTVGLLIGLASKGVGSHFYTVIYIVFNVLFIVFYITTLTNLFSRLQSKTFWVVAISLALLLIVRNYTDMATNRVIAEATINSTAKDLEKALKGLYS